MTSRCYIALLLACLFEAPARTEVGLPPALKGVGIDQRLDERVPLELLFRNEMGQTVPLSECTQGKPTILVLAYYRCPMLCTQVLNGLLDAVRTLSFDLGDDFRIVTVSIDARETPDLARAKKSQYVSQYGRPGAADGWHFLTGQQKSIDRLAEVVGFHYRFDPKTNQFAHASGIMVLTPDGRIARYYYGIRFPSRDLRLGLVEASQNRIGSPVDRVLLFCFHYDATTGKYTPMVMSFVRLGGAATVLILGLALAKTLRRDRRKLRSPALSGFRCGGAQASSAGALADPASSRHEVD